MDQKPKERKSVYDDEDDVAESARDDAKDSRRTEFDCPDCNANNPTESFGDGDEVSCHYCGSTYRASVSNGKLKLKEV